MKATLLLLVVLISPNFSLAAQEPWQWQQEEVARYFSGLNEIQTTGWGRLEAKVNTVIRQLIEDTDEIYKVVPGQTFSIGQAHVGGWIILDISTATKDQDILAFWLAHEWAHQHLGHQANIYNPQENIWKFRKTATEEEDAADEWAGGFLARYDYPIENVLKELNNLPDLHGDFAHSDGEQRGQIVASAYESYEKKDLYDDNYEITYSNGCNENEGVLGIVYCLEYLEMGDNSLDDARKKNNNKDFDLSMSLLEAAIQSYHKASVECVCESNLIKSREGKNNAINLFNSVGESNGYSRNKLRGLVRKFIEETDD